MMPIFKSIIVISYLSKSKINQNQTKPIFYISDSQPGPVPRHTRVPCWSVKGADKFWIIFIYISVLLFMVPHIVIFWDVRVLPILLVLKGAVNPIRFKNIDLNQQCPRVFFCSPQMWRLNTAIRHIVRIELFVIRNSNFPILGQILSVISFRFSNGSVWMEFF
jgi:hypothetical protein